RHSRVRDRRDPVRHETRRLGEVARVDLWYGILAGAIVVVGFSRAVFAAKGWAYYSVNMFFWAKMAAFAAVALLSIAPAIRIIRWRRALAGERSRWRQPTLRTCDASYGLRQRCLRSFPRSPPPWHEATARWRSEGILYGAKNYGGQRR